MTTLEPVRTQPNELLRHIEGLAPHLRIDTLKRALDVVQAMITRQSVNLSLLSGHLPGESRVEAKKRRAERAFRKEQLTRELFLSLIVPLLPTAVLIVRVLPLVAAGQRVTLSTYRRGLSVKGVRSTLLVTLLQIAAIFSVYAVAGSYLGGRFGSSAQWISVTLLGFGLGGVIGNALSSLAVIRFGSHATLLFTLLASAVTVALLLVAPALPWLGLAAFFLWSVFANMFQAPQQARLLGLQPSERGLMLALNASILYLGISLGSWLGSGLLPRLGAEHLVWPALGLLVMAILVGQRRWLGNRRLSSTS